MVRVVLPRHKLISCRESRLAQVTLFGVVLMAPVLYAQQPSSEQEASAQVAVEASVENNSGIRQEAETVFSDLNLLEQSCPVDVPNYFDEPINPKQDSLMQKSVDWLVDTHDSFSSGLLGVAVGMDDFLAGGRGSEVDQQTEEINGTYFKISFSQRFEKSAEGIAEEKIKLKVDLPRTESRMKLVFDSDPNDQDSLDERNRNVPTEEVRLGDESGATGALSFLLYESKLWRVNPQIGVRGPLPLEPFARLKLRRTQQLDDNWRMRFRQSFYYFHGDGFGERTQLYFERPINENYYFRNKIEAQWQDETNSFEFAEIFSTTHFLNEKHSINYDIGVIGENRPVPRVTSYFVRSTLRKRLYRQWLFASFIPELYFPREEGFELTPSFTLRLEVIFANDNDIY